MTKLYRLGAPLSSVVITLIAVMALTGCQGSSSGKAGGSNPEQKPQAEFEKAVNGQWVSECQLDQGGSSIETLDLNAAGSGTSNSDYFQTANCTGEIVKTEGPVAFTYALDGAAPQANQGVPVTIAVAGKALKVSILVQGELMTISYPQGSTRYRRTSTGNTPPTPGNPVLNPGTQPGVPGANPQPGTQPGTQPGVPGPNPPPAGGQTAMARFDQFAAGTWVTKNCYQMEDGGSFRRVVSIAGNGKGSQIFNVYQDNFCGGEPEGQGASNFSYTVNQFSGNSGQVRVDGAALKISFGANTMIMEGGGETVEYQKIR